MQKSIKTEPENVAVKRISKDVLNMNFMKRTTVQIERQQRIQQQQIVNEAIQSGKIAYGPPPYYPTVEHIDDDPNITLGGIQSEWRYTVLEEQKFGRFSFNGQNPEVEKLMVFHERRRLGLADPDEEERNNDEEDDSDASDDDRESGELTDSDDNHETTGGKKPKVECEDEDQPPAKKFRTGDVRFRRPRDDVDQSTSSNQPNPGKNIKQENLKKRGKRGGRNRGWKKGKNGGGNRQQIQQQQRQESPKKRGKRGGQYRGWKGKGRKGGGGNGGGSGSTGNVKREQN